MVETVFTPWLSLGGGALIGLSAVMLMLTHGRIAGATGILAGVFMPADLDDWLWRAALIAGMVIAPAVMALATGQMPAITVPVSGAALIVGGVIVGIGVTLAGGCTSGHGVCGLARLSPRSFVAVPVFMATALATVFIARHVIGD